MKALSNQQIFINCIVTNNAKKMTDLEEGLEDCREAMEDITKIYILHTKMKRNEIKQQLKKDRWWDFDTCKQKGLIDEEWKNEM